MEASGSASESPVPHGPVEQQTAKGPAKDFCPTVGGQDGGHFMATHMRGGALAHIEKCVWCDWIDFDELDDQIMALLAKAIEWEARDGISGATLKHADDSTWRAEAARFRRVLAQPPGDD